MISICVGIKNRTKVITKEGIQLNLFKNSIYSIVKASNNINFPIEIVIVDYNSNDVILEDWIYHAIKDTNIELTIIKLPFDEPFSRGKSLNIAGGAAKYEYLFFNDADMLLDETVLYNGINYLKQDKIYFPICLSFTDHTHKYAWYRTAGWGMVFVKKSIWIKHKYPEYFKWGKEDEVLRDSLLSEKLENIVRTPCKGLFHQWHPIAEGSTTTGTQKIE